MLFRPANQSDAPLLLDALYEAFNWKGTEALSRDQLLEDPQIGHYVEGWQRDTDFGVVATNDDGTPLGAAWCRLFDQTDAGYGFIAPHIPELTMAVFPGNRGRGVGKQLLTGIISAAGEQGYALVSLSVEDDNAARHLYESAGFTPAGRNGDSDTMIATTESL